MPIVFEPLVSSPQTFGDGIAVLPLIDAYGQENPGAYGVDLLPTITSTGAGAYGELTGGEGSALLPLLLAFGTQSAGGYGIAILPAFTTDAIDNGAPVPSGGSAVGYLPAFASAGSGWNSLVGSAEPVALSLTGFGIGTYTEAVIFANTTGDGFAVLPPLFAYGQESGDGYAIGYLPSLLPASNGRYTDFGVLDGYAIGYLPALGGRAAQSFPTITALGSLVTPSPHMFAWAEESIAYMAESITIAYSIETSAIYAIREQMALLGSATATANLIAAIAETLRLDQRLTPVLEAVLSDTATLTAVLDGTPLRTVAIIDSLVLAGIATSSINALAMLTEAITLAEVLRRVVDDAELADAANFADALDVRLSAVETLLANATFADSVQGLAIVTCVVSDAVALDEELTPSAMLIAAISESIGFSVGFTFDGVPYVGIAMNSATKAITEYAPYDFNSLANFNGTLYGAGPAGLYRLEGDDDDGTPIDAYLRTALQRIADGKQSRVDSAYLGYRSDGTLQLKVIVTGDRGEKVGYVYDLAQKAAAASRAGRIKIGRGLKSAYWAFELSNTSGSDFGLDVIEIHPLVLDRRLP